MRDPLDKVRQQAVLLSDDSMGVDIEEQTRKIQFNHRSFYTTLRRSWLSQLDLAEQSTETKHSLSLGVRPVIVQQPAIIVQPAAVLEGDAPAPNRLLGSGYP